MDLGLQGKNVLITGGASGIGLGISRALAKEGMNIAVASRNPDPEVVEEIQSYGVKCIRICADLSREEDCIRMAAEAIDAFKRIDCFVNNAAWTWHQPVTKITDEAFTNTIHTNLRAAVFGCREICRHMIENGGGSIVIIGSTVRFFPAFKEASYRISKMGLKMYMETLAIEMAPHKIRVNMVTPGLFLTKMVGGHIRGSETGPVQHHALWTDRKPGRNRLRHRFFALRQGQRFLPAAGTWWWMAGLRCTPCCRPIRKP